MHVYMKTLPPNLNAQYGVSLCSDPEIMSFHIPYPFSYPVVS